MVGPMDYYEMPAPETAKVEMKEAPKVEWHNAPDSKTRPYPTNNVRPKQRSPYDSVQNLMIQQQQDRMREKRIAQQESQRQNVQANQQNQKMGQHLDRAFAEMQTNFRQGAAVMQQYMNDPLMSQLMEISMERAKGGAIDDATLGKMQGQASARNAANTNASVRRAKWGMSGSGVRGAARDTLLAALRNDGAARGERNAQGIDIDVAKFNASQRGQALSQALGAGGARAGMAQDYARYMNSWNPLGAMGQMQGLQAPMQQIGYNVGRMG